MDDVAGWVRLAAVLVFMVAVASVLLRGQGVRHAAGAWTAVGRAALQLAVVALLLRGVLAWWWALGLFVLLMLTTASLTGAGRAKGLHRGRTAAALGIVSGPVVSVTIILASGIVDRDAQEIVAVTGILIGNAMSASTLSLRHFLLQLDSRQGEVEAWLALGAMPRQAVADLRRTAIHEALIPNLDQTRSTGLVTLPGAFVGALFGGASPVQAAVFQLIVLVGILLTQTITASVATWWVSLSPVLPPHPGVRSAR